MLQIQKLVSGYNGNKILRGLSMKINPREIVAIFGHNGAGKSTLMKSILNISSIYSGKILFEGKDLSMSSTNEIVKRGISYVPQVKKIFRNMTVQENLLLDSSNDDLEHLYRLFPVLREKENLLAQKLSGGQQQALGICRALSQNPRLILLDEPSLGLDYKSVKSLFIKIKEMNKEGMTILIAEQNINLALSIANRYYFLKDGKVFLEGRKKLPKNIWEKLD